MLTTMERGAQLFAYESRGRVLHPQQVRVGEALDEHKSVSAILMSRRSSKTESVLLWTFAMMEAHPGLQVAFTMATTREAARAKFLADVLPTLEELAEVRDDVHLLKGAGYESAELNGSLFAVLAPNDKAFRSKAFDIVIVDESGEADPSIGEDLLPAMLPTLDTSWLGMLILMGTAGDYREGNLLWTALHDEDNAVVDYSMGDAVDVDRLKDWEYARGLLERYHPGVGTLTTTDRIKRNWALLTPERFAREYLGLWGTAGGAGGMFSPDTWANLLLFEEPEPPARFALAVSATDESASIVAAWRVDGEARVLLLRHGAGRGWLPIAARDMAKKYRVPVVIDPRESQIMADVKQKLEQLRPATRLAIQEYEDVAAAHERIKAEVEAGTVRHFGQPEMTAAFTGVRRVQMGAKWKFGHVADDVDITAAKAATLALRAFDAQPRAVRGTLQPIAV